ncbi:LCP family protein [Clostridium sp. D2Q-11]|uniref:LCP family protein n=1 Tax=Anaeromonas frigoriresistens TaxID=2683708 RepID=A0A942UTC6_9FIRM|nr:LCP family protein [Anaeromonas frigoriresistens]MBS4537600.1 LCP family protein [Anaeromonas frigoriresistens]
MMTKLILEENWYMEILFYMFDIKEKMINMKYFLKVFSIAFLCFSLMIGAGLYTYFKVFDPTAEADDGRDEHPMKNLSEEEIEKLPPFEKAIANSDRVNVLLIGVEKEGRSDTLVFASFDPNTKSVDMISVPRDTYYHDEGYNSADHRKLNAVYIRSLKEGHNVAAEKTMDAIQEILGVPIDHYATISYDGVENIVDSLGGVEMDVPQNMKYEYFHSDGRKEMRVLKKGTQVLDGSESVGFLRFRKGYSNGDIGRVQAQQKFIKAALKKALGFNLPKVALTAAKEVKTDMSVFQITSNATKAIGMNMEDVNTHVLPGEAESMTFDGWTLSYFSHDSEKTRELMEEIYGVSELEENKNE